MMKKTFVRTLIITLAAALGFAGIIACDEPEQADEPVAEEGEEELEEPEAPGEADEAPDQPALDQPDGPPGQPPGHPGMDEELTDEDVDQFADVIKALQELDEERDDPQARMEAAETPQERQAIQQELMSDMQEAIEGTGMSFQEFMMMSQRLQQDPDFQERLEERVDLSEIMEEQQQAPPPPQ